MEADPPPHAGSASQPPNEALELPVQLVEELGLLLSPKEIAAARSTCRIWRDHLAQRVRVQPSGDLFELLATPESDTWNHKVSSMAAVLPALSQLLVYAGGRVSAEALDQEVAMLAQALPRLDRLELRFLHPPTGQLQGSYPSVPSIPRGVSSLTCLTQLSLVMCSAPTPAHIPHLPPSLNELRIATGYGDQGVTDAVLQLLGAQLPCLMLLEADVAPYTVSEVGLRGLPASLKHLVLYGIITLGSEEVQALCSATPVLHRLKVEVPSDQHAALAQLLDAHPTLSHVDLDLNHMEADTDHALGEVLSSLQAMCRPKHAPDHEPAGHAHQPWTHHTWHGASPSRPGVVTSSPRAGRPAPGVIGGAGDGLTSPCASPAKPKPAGEGPSSSTPTPLPPPPLARGVTSLTLHQFSVPRHEASTFFSLFTSLPSLTSLSITEPWITQGGVDGDWGSLSDLSHLTSLRSLFISLMPGFVIPALLLTPPVLDALTTSCPHLVSFSGLNAVHQEVTCLTPLTRLANLESLVLSPVTFSEPWGHTHTLDLTHLPSLTSLSLHGFHLTHHTQAHAPQPVPEPFSLAKPFQKLEDLVLTRCWLGEGLLPAGRLLQCCTGLQSLALKHVVGVEDTDFADPALRLNLCKLTSLQVTGALEAQLGQQPQPNLTLAGLAHCSALTALKRLEWRTWGESTQADTEPQVLRQLASGAQGLHVLTLREPVDAEVRAATKRVAQQLLPMCCLLP